MELNKVSTGEIVEELVSQGLVRETGKLEVSNGRRPTTLEIVKDARFVLCVDIGSRNISVALCNLLGETVRFERFPCNTESKVEEFCADILKSCVRTMKLVKPEQVLGAGITIAGTISVDEKTIISCPYLPWQNISMADVFEKTFKVSTVICSGVTALVAAEKIRNAKVLVSSKPIVYLDWGDHISLAFVSGSNIAGTNPDFGHLKADGQKTLEECCASWAISDSEEKLKNLWDSVPEDSLVCMAKALDMAHQVTGAGRVVFSGESASIDLSCLNRIRRECPDFEIEKSGLGDKANIIAAAEFALDRFFYQNSVLDEMRAWI